METNNQVSRKIEIRSESDVFSELAHLCSSDGYVHALAWICALNEIVMGSKPYQETEFKSENLPELGNSEIMTLIGLLIKEPINYDLPSRTVVNDYVNRTYALLDEIHITSYNDSSFSMPSSTSTATSKILREAIFYAGDSAYHFQYSNLATQKYAADSQWLLSNKNIDLSVAESVCQTIRRLHEQQINEARLAHIKSSTVHQSLLRAFQYSFKDIGFSESILKEQAYSFIKSLTLPSGKKNSSFTSINDFNIAYQYPIIAKDNGEFIIFSYYSLSQAFYENPFFWMLEDKKYISIANQNRGNAAESITADHLTRVFPRKNVFKNVELIEANGKTIKGEIDVFVVYGDYIIIAQVKSKRLTMEARKGNENRLREDFKKAISDAADQAMSCAHHIGDPGITLRSRDGDHPPQISQSAYVLPMTVVLDHYPALFLQTQFLLRDKSTERISPPFVTDVFALDTVAEILDSPLKFLHYLLQRGRMPILRLANQEHELISLYLHFGLIFNENITGIYADQTLAADVDLIMCIRRDNAEEPEPSINILDQFKNTPFGNILANLDQINNPASINLALCFFDICQSSEEVEKVNREIEKCLNLSKLRDDCSQFSFKFSHISVGILIMCTPRFDEVSIKNIDSISILRKYQEKLTKYFGVMLSSSGELIYIRELNYRWKKDENLEAILNAP